MLTSPRILFVLHGYPPNQAAGAEIETQRRALALRARGIAVAVLAVDEVGDAALGEPRMKRDEVDGVPVWRLSYALQAPWGVVEEFDHPAVRLAVAEVSDAFAPTHVHQVSGYRTTAAAIHAGIALGLPVLVTATDYWFVCPRITRVHVPDGPCSVPDDPWDCGACLANERRRHRLTHRLTRGASSRALVSMAKRGWPLATDVNRYGRYVAERRDALRTALGQVDVLLAASSFLSDTLDTFLGQPSATTTLRQGLDTTHWRPATAADSASGPAEPAIPVGLSPPLRIGYIGQLAPHKGVADLVRAVRGMSAAGRRSRPVRLTLHGDPDKAWPADRAALERAIGGDTRIIFAGPFDNRDIRRVHAGLDVLVVPSRWYENSPNVILEAFACGTPVVTSDLGGMAELIEDGQSGLLFAPGDVVDLRACLERLCNEPDLLARLRTGLPPVKTIDEEIDELVELYRSLMPPAVAAEPAPAPAVDRA